MALIKCPECNNEVSDTALTCPKCGYQLNPPPITKGDQTTSLENSIPNKRGVNTIAIIILAIIILVGLGKLSNYNSELPSSSITSTVSTVGVARYEVRCSRKGFDVTYQNEQGNTEQITINNSDHWSYPFTTRSGEFVYVAAQSHNENATITAKIYFKGNVIEEATSSGSYVIVNAAGSVP